MALPLDIYGQHFELDPSGAIFWKDQNTLLIADLHLGKVTHFRKHGAAIPPHVAYQNMEKLTRITNDFQPQNVCFLGDLFHSNFNTEWHDFAQWVSYTPASVVLINGNHDILPPHLFESIGVTLLDEQVIGSFLLTHHPTEKEGFFNLCGHVHPGVRLHGVGRQMVKLPCFYKMQQQLILPAFGNFTGKHILRPEDAEAIYVIVDDEVVAME